MKNLLAAVLLAAVSCGATRNLTFPDGFWFGAGSAAYQVEGAWNTSGKGESIWDRLSHSKQALNPQTETADVAADQYHHYKEDVQGLKKVGFNFYRFSVSWPRVLPKGDLSVINQDGLDYYNNLINELVNNDIVPIVTMYHWDLPQHLQDLGGFANDIIIDYFEDYANLLFTHYGDRVKWWITFNEPLSFVNGYSSTMIAPAVNAPGVGLYLAAHNVLKAHARVYHLYDDHFRSQQRGKVGITLNTEYPMPKTNSEADINATEIYLQFQLGWFAHPIYSSEGDYPAVMKERVANKSRAEGLPRSRLPEFDEHWVKYIRGTHDFYGMNLYTANLISLSNTTADATVPPNSDMGSIIAEQDPSWPYEGLNSFRYTPFAMRKMLKLISDNYNNVSIFITENGWCDHGEINDTMRARFLVNYYAAVLDAIHLDNVNVIGHTTWAFVDTFEWFTYSTRFGLFYVNFTDPARPRTPKFSTTILSSIIKTRKLPEEYLDKE
ncbi:myrosinase 1-like [Bacillus rossius redtenbacheri]|uniref:myrosinase 1-like n=1 Tax=Bacillus rossius redtenbacheri TaxID=93214 RepID=UPI002FDD9D30